MLGEIIAIFGCRDKADEAFYEAPFLHEESLILVVEMGLVGYTNSYGFAIAREYF